jgi:hypothetical protein|eukprot:COSAG01_NODE_8856_length_2636_cov_3.298384_3_plen_62_part_00
MCRLFLSRNNEAQRPGSVNAREKPLALYVFTANGATAQRCVDTSMTLRCLRSFCLTPARDV